MKKLKYKRILASILLLVTMLSVAQPIFAASGTGEWVGGQYASYIKTTDNADTEYGIIIRKLINYNTGEKRTVFCAEHGVDFKTDVVYNGSYYTPVKADVRKACKIAYFGWYEKYGNYVINGGILAESMEARKMDYVYTQNYIWEALGQTNATFIDSNIQKEYVKFKNEVDSKMAKMRMQPSFVSDTITLECGETKILTDSNKVLADYVSFDKTIDGIRISHKKGQNTLSISIDEKCNKETYRITESTMKNWGIIKEATADKDTTVYFTFKEGVQNQLYALNYNDTISMSLNLKINQYGSLKINKIDLETNQPIADTTFELSDSTGKIVRTGTTDKNGQLVFDKLKRGHYKLKETKSNSLYLVNTDVYDIVINPNETTIKNITNEHKKGDLKIYKVDADNNKIAIGGVRFALYSYELDKITGYYTTDVNGEIYIKGLRIGKWALIEEETNKWYNLLENQIEIKVEWNETTNEKIENELKKLQIKIIKVDEENHEIKLENVEFEVMDEKGRILETIKTDKNGEAVTSRYPVRDFSNLYLKETITNKKYVLDDTVHKIELKENEIITKIFENKKIKGQIEIIKTSEEDSKITGMKAGAPMTNVEFDIFDENKQYIETIVTNEDGKAITSLLEKGIKYVREKNSKGTEWYILNTKEYSAEIVNDGDIITLNISNIPENPDVDIEKEGIIQTTANQEIKYDFKIKNTGNVPLSDFTWYDYLPTDYVRITKLITGTYNQDLNYSIYYKTNKNDYKLLRDNLNTKENNYIDFSNLELAEDEYITEFKADFGTVDVGFESVINPYIFVRVNSNVNNDDIFTNRTRIEGYNKTYMVWDEDDHTTKVYEKEIEVKKLPRTGK